MCYRNAAIIVFVQIHNRTFQFPQAKWISHAVKYVSRLVVPFVSEFISCSDVYVPCIPSVKRMSIVN